MVKIFSNTPYCTGCNSGALIDLEGRGCAMDTDYPPTAAFCVEDFTPGLDRPRFPKGYTAHPGMCQGYGFGNTVENASCENACIKIYRK